MSIILYKNLYIEIFKKCSPSCKCNLALFFYPKENYLFNLLDDKAWFIFANQGNLNALKLLVKLNVSKNKNIQKYIKLILVESCKNNFLNIVKWITEEFDKIELSKNVMDKVSKNGYFKLLKYMNEIRKDNCTTSAIYYAAKYEYFNIVKYLYENRYEGCNEYTVSKLLSKYNDSGNNKKIEIIKYILDNDATMILNHIDFDNIIYNNYHDFIEYIPKFNIKEEHIEFLINHTNNDIEKIYYLIYHITYVSNKLLKIIIDYGIKNNNYEIINKIYNNKYCNQNKNILLIKAIDNNDLEITKKIIKQYNLNILDLPLPSKDLSYEKLDKDTIDYLYNFYKENIIRNKYGHYIKTLNNNFIKIIVNSNIKDWNDNSENIFKHLIEKKYIKLNLDTCEYLLERCELYHYNRYNNFWCLHIKRKLLNLMPDF